MEVFVCTPWSHIVLNDISSRLEVLLVGIESIYAEIHRLEAFQLIVTVTVIPVGIRISRGLTRQSFVVPETEHLVSQVQCAILTVFQLDGLELRFLQHCEN